MSKKKLNSLNSSVESEDSGLGLKVRMIQRPRGNNPGFNKEVKIIPSLSQASWEHNNLLVSGQTITTNTVAKSTKQDSEIKSSLKMTSEILERAQYLNMTYLQQDFPVKLFPLLENARVFKTKQGELFSTKYAELLEVKDQSSYSLRMLKDYFLMTQAEPSQLYSFHWMSLGMMSNGRCLTLSIGCPRTAKGSLSSVLEEKVDKKYYLSEKSLKSFIRNELNVVDELASSIKATYCKGGISKFGTNLLYEGAVLSEKNKKWLEDGKELSRNFPQGQRVYSSKGIASNICGDAGGLGGKTGLYIVADRTRTYADKGRNLESPKSITNALSGIQKDNLILEDKNDLLFNSQKSRISIGNDKNANRGNHKNHHGNQAKGKQEDLEAQADVGSVDKPIRIRRLTPKECERLQGFPNDWTKEVSDTQRYKQMGNAVSVPVIEAIGRKILEVIE